MSDTTQEARGLIADARAGRLDVDGLAGTTKALLRAIRLLEVLCGENDALEQRVEVLRDLSTYGIKVGQLWLTPDGREVEVRRVCRDDRDTSISKGEMVAKVHYGRVSTISCRRLSTFKLVRDVE